MTNSIGDAYKNKEYGWYIAYIVLIVVALKLGGLIGLVVSVLVISGIYKANKNQKLSKRDKISLSVGYVLCGIIGFFIILSLLNATIFNYLGLGFSFFNKPEVNQILNSKPSEPIAVSPTKDTEVNTSEYVNQNHNFKINQPKGWTVNENQPNIIAEFDDPTANQFGAITIGSDLNVGNYSKKQYSAGIMQGMTEEGAKNISIIKQGDLTLNGNSAYFVEFNYDHSFPDGSKYSMHALSVSLMRNGTGYALLGVTQKETWNLF